MSLEDIVRAVAEGALSEEERLGFLDLCEARAAEDLLTDRDRVRSYLGVIEHGVEDGNVLELELAEPTAAALILLLDRAAEWSYAERRVLAGAVEYFLRNEDTDADFNSMHGFDDDARVVAAVAEALGHDELAQRLNQRL
jgi:hypothetical protein